MEDVLAIRDEYRLQEWSQIIQAGQNSGLSKREFCRQNGISERQYYYWLKKLRETVVETASPHFVRLEDPVNKREQMDKLEKDTAITCLDFATEHYEDVIRRREKEAKQTL